MNVYWSFVYTCQLPGASQWLIQGPFHQRPRSRAGKQKDKFIVRWNYVILRTSLLVRWWRIRLPMKETQELRVWSLDWEDPLQKEIATHSSIFAWKIPWTEEPGGLQSMGSQRVEHYWAAEHIYTVSELAFLESGFLTCEIETVILNHRILLQSLD